MERDIPTHSGACSIPLAWRICLSGSASCTTRSSPFHILTRERERTYIGRWNPWSSSTSGILRFCACFASQSHPSHYIVPGRATKTVSIVYPKCVLIPAAFRQPLLQNPSGRLSVVGRQRRCFHLLRPQMSEFKVACPEQRSRCIWSKQDEAQVDRLLKSRISLVWAYYTNFGRLHVCLRFQAFNSQSTR